MPPAESTPALLPATPRQSPGAPQCASDPGRQGAAPLPPLPPAVRAGHRPPQPFLQCGRADALRLSRPVALPSRAARSFCKQSLNCIAQECPTQPAGPITCIARQPPIDEVQAAQQLSYSCLECRRPQAVLLGHPGGAAQPLSHLPAAAAGSKEHTAVQFTTNIMHLPPRQHRQHAWQALPAWLLPQLPTPTHCSSGAACICASMAASTP